VTVTPDAVLVAEEQARTAARLRGATQALNVLLYRSPADQQRASLFALSLLSTEAAPTDWSEAGLPKPPRADSPAGADQQASTRLPVDHRAVVLLARTALDLYSAGLRISERPRHWERLARFFADRLPGTAPELLRLRGRVLTARTDAGDISPEVFDELTNAVERYRDLHGENAYRTSIAKTDLATAFRLRRAENDLAASAALAEEAAKTRAAAYGPDHPVTLMARSLVNHSLLLQAEISSDEERPRLASQVLTKVTAVRAARDRLYGMTAPNATMNRRHEARALLLLGQPEQARQVLELALACETAHNGRHEPQAMADTHQLLAKVHHDLGDPGQALKHAREASRIFDLHNPDGRGARLARRLIAELTASSPAVSRGPG
jgi:tetratricopeptide (TPR) repeat protein